MPEVGHWLLGHLRSAVQSARGKMTLGDFADAVASGAMQAWIVWADDLAVALVVTELARYPRQRVCRIVVCDGEGLADWLPLIEEIEAWAVQEGCGAMQLIARRGYARVLAPYGYAQTHVLLEKELS